MFDFDDRFVFMLDSDFCLTSELRLKILKKPSTETQTMQFLKKFNALKSMIINDISNFFNVQYIADYHRSDLKLNKTLIVNFSKEVLSALSKPFPIPGKGPNSCVECP